MSQSLEENETHTYTVQKEVRVMKNILNTLKELRLKVAGVSRSTERLDRQVQANLASRRSEVRQLLGTRYRIIGTVSKP